MKRFMLWVMAAILICGSMVFSSCSNDDNPTSTKGIVLLAKRGDIDYFRQIEKAFRDACREKGLKAYYYCTTADKAYEDQLAAMEEVKKLGKQVKGIIYTPCYGVNGESAEDEVAAFAKEQGIPVVIIDSEVSHTSPLAGCPYFGTNNTDAGLDLALAVDEEEIAAFAMETSPGVERAEAFKTLKPDTEINTVGEDASSEVEAAIVDFDNFVFFNGNLLVDNLSLLKENEKTIYAFDVCEEFLDELIAGSSYLKGIMAQNTFSMAKKAVEAVINNANKGEKIPTFYITKDNLDDPNVQPFLKFYGK